MRGLSILTVGNMYPPHHLGGAELIWRSAVGHLRDAGHRVRVLTTDYRSASPDPTIAEDSDVHRELPWYWRDHDFPRFGPLERLRIERAAAAALDRHIAEFEPDVVCWWSMGGLPMALLERPARAGLPASGVLLDDWLLYGPVVDGWQRLCRRIGPLGRPLAALARVPASVDVGGAAEWIFMSETLRSRAAEAGIPVEGSRVIYRGVEAGEFEPRAEREWGGRLLCLGRIDPRKGVGVAIRALAELPGCSLRVIGDGDRAHLADLQELTTELGLEQRVEFARVPRAQVPDEFGAADALLFPVLWEEPWGLVPLEAMASGIPVVATGAGGSSEYLRDGENALIYEPRGEPSALATTVRRLEDPVLRGRLRAGGLRTVAEYSVAAFDAGVEAAIRGLVR